MTDAKEHRLVFDPADAPDADRVYANYLRTCAMAGVEPVSRERAHVHHSCSARTDQWSRKSAMRDGRSWTPPDFVSSADVGLSIEERYFPRISHDDGRARQPDGWVVRTTSAGSQLATRKHRLEGAMDTYFIDAGGAWRHYHPRAVPAGWRMLGTIRCQSDDSIGALGRSPAGLFAQINAAGVRVLDQRAVAEALRRVVLP